MTWPSCQPDACQLHQTSLNRQVDRLHGSNIRTVPTVDNKLH